MAAAAAAATAVDTAVAVDTTVATTIGVGATTIGVATAAAAAAAAMIGTTTAAVRFISQRMMLSRIAESHSQIARCRMCTLLRIVRVLPLMFS